MCDETKEHRVTVDLVRIARTGTSPEGAISSHQSLFAPVSLKEELRRIKEKVLLDHC